MACNQDSRTARVLKFSGDWQGRFEPTPYIRKALQSALHDARRIMAAKRESDDWTARLLVSLLAVMDKGQLARLELVLERQPESEEAGQALALVRLAIGDKEHVSRVKTAMKALVGEARR